MGRIFFLALLLVGCGPNAVDDVVPIDGGFFVDSTVPRKDAGFLDVGAPDVGADTTPYNGGGPFLCVDCVCDGTIDLCYLGGGGGGAPMVDAGADADPFGDAGECRVDAGQPWCMQVPIQCLPNPTCACLQQALGCACSVDPSGSGFVITCPPKP